MVSADNELLKPSAWAIEPNADSSTVGEVHGRKRKSTINLVGSIFDHGRDAGA
jgi:hypothetical protein